VGVRRWWGCDGFDGGDVFIVAVQDSDGQVRRAVGADDDRIENHRRGVVEVQNPGRALGGQGVHTGVGAVKSGVRGAIRREHQRFMVVEVAAGGTRYILPAEV
jgi:hypothetical protein